LEFGGVHKVSQASLNERVNLYYSYYE
jgi:hypothetical protein